MSELTEDARNVIKKEVDKNIQEFRHAIFIINAYKWIIGVILVAFGLGTYLGIDALIENKVNSNIRAYDSFMNAETYISKDQYEKAYENIGTSWKEIKDKNLDSKDLQDIYSADMITILSNTTKYDKYGMIFNGQNTWNELKKNPDFVEFIENFSGNYYSKLDLSFCKIKFESDSTAKIELNRIIQISNNDLSLSSHKHEEHYDRMWYPFVVSIIQNNSQDAKNYQKNIKDNYPDALNKYLINGSINADVLEIIYWENINHKVNKGKFSFNDKLKVLLSN